MKNWTQSETQLLQDVSVPISVLHKKMPHRSMEAIHIKSSRMGYNRQGDAFLRNSNNYLDLLQDNNFCEIIDGELLGDGCIIKNKRGHYSFAYCTANEQYCNFLHKVIAQKTHSKSKVYKSAPSTPHLNPLGELVISNNSYQIGISHKVFKFFRERWYGEKKYIPQDLRLTSTVCRHWYIGDGTISNKKSLVIKLATECFTKDDLEKLINKLSNIDIDARLCVSYEDKFTIAIYANNALKFLKYIGKCPVDSYQYKWNTNGYRKRHKRCLCGRWFHFLSHTNRKNYCSSLCQQHYKSLNYNKKLFNTKKQNLTNQAVKVGSKHFYYILGHVLCTGNVINKSTISIKVLDKQLILLMREKLSLKHNSYNNTISFKSKKLVNLSDNLSIKFDFTKIPTKYHGDTLRGIFDAAGMINLTPDNYFQIILRYKHASYLGKMLGINIESSNIFRIKKSQRALVFHKMYIHSDEIKSKKKYDLFCRSLNTVRKSIPRDEEGRFKQL